MAPRGPSRTVRANADLLTPNLAILGIFSLPLNPEGSVFSVGVSLGSPLMVTACISISRWV